MVRRLGPVLAALAVVLATVGARAGDPQTIHIHTAVWEDYTNADGSGFGWDVVRAVYDAVGIDITFDTMPYGRAVDTVVHGKADAWIGSYGDEVPEAVYPDWHYDADRVDAIFKKDADITWRGPSTLRGADVVWLHEYQMDKYLDVAVNGAQTHKNVNALRMVARDRVAFYIGTAYEFEAFFDDADVPADLAPGMFRREHLMDLKLYVAFAPTERGRHFADLWDEHFPRLLEDGTIAGIYDAHGFDLWPFDRPRESDPNS